MSWTRKDAERAILTRDRPAAWLRKYAVRTRKGYIQRAMAHKSGMDVYCLTPNLEKAIMLDNRGEDIKLATKAARMGAVIKEVDIDRETGKRKTVGTVVF